VRTAEEALSVLDGSGLNHLQLGATLVHKS
jgi:hypothetical protein